MKRRSAQLLDRIRPLDYIPGNLYDSNNYQPFFLTFIIVAAVPAAPEIQAVNPNLNKSLAYQGLILKEMIDHG